MDILAAFQELELVKETLERERNEATETFATIFKEMIRKASVTGGSIQKPRTCNRQLLRDNMEGSEEEYYR